MIWDSNFTTEDSRNGYPKTLSAIRDLPPWKLNEEKRDLLKHMYGIHVNNCREAYHLFEIVEKERDDIVETNIFTVFGDPVKERPYYPNGRYV